MYRVLLFSESRLFGGSEYVIENILKCEKMRNLYSFSFAYRSHRIYDKKVKEHDCFKICDYIYPISLYNLDWYNNFAFRISNSFVRKLLLLPSVALDKIGIIRWINSILLKKFLYLKNFDIIHINNGGYPGSENCLLLARIARKMGFKVIMQVNNMAQQRDKWWDIYIDKSVDLFITASEVAKLRLHNVRSFDKDKIVTLPNYVMDASFLCENNLSLKKEYGFNNDDVIIIEVALLQERKGQRFLIDAISNLNTKQNKSKYKLLLIGDGEDMIKLKAYVKQRELDTCVYFLGYQDNYLDYVKESDIVVLPSIKDEDMPLIILSAMSLGKPIVSTTVGGIPEEIENGISGILVNPLCEDFLKKLSDAIEFAYENREKLGSNARKRYEEHFSQNMYISSLSNIYKTIILK